MAWALASQPFFAPEPHLCRSEVSHHVFRHRSQQGFCRRRVSPTATGQWPPSFCFKAVSEALAIQETKGHGMLGSGEGD